MTWAIAGSLRLMSAYPLLGRFKQSSGTFTQAGLPAPALAASTPTPNSTNPTTPALLERRHSFYYPAWTLTLGRTNEKPDIGAVFRLAKCKMRSAVFLKRIRAWTACSSFPQTFRAPGSCAKPRIEFPRSSLIFSLAMWLRALHPGTGIDCCLGRCWQSGT